MTAQAIVEQIDYSIVIRWRFVLRDEDGAVKYESQSHILKADAMAERRDLLERAGEWRRRLHEGYADADHPDAHIYRVMLRAEYRTRDKASAPGG
jgi:hypothetical protein